MMALSRRVRFRLSSLFVIITCAAVGCWWIWTRPTLLTVRQMRIGRSIVHSRERHYLEPVFDDEVKSRLVTILGDSRLSHWGSVRWLASFDDGLVSFGSDGALILWNLSDGSIRHGLYDVQVARYLRKKKQVLFWQNNQPLQVLSVESGNVEPSPIKKSMPEAGCELYCSDDGSIIAMIDSTEHLLVWRDGVEIVSTDLQGPHGDSKRADVKALSRDGTTLILAHPEKLDTYDVKTGQYSDSIALPIADHRASIHNVSFAEDDGHVALGDAIGRIFLVDWKARKVIAALPPGPSSVRALALVGTNQLIAGDQDGLFTYWNAYDDKRQRFSMYAGKSVTAIDMEKGWYAAHHDNKIDSFHENNVVRIAGGPRHDALCFAFSPDNRYIAIGGSAGLITIRETSQWTQVRSWPAHVGGVQRLLWSPRGNVLVSLGDDNTLVIWDPEKASETKASHHWGSHKRALAFDAEGKFLARFPEDLSKHSADVLDMDSLQTKYHVPVPGSGRGDAALTKDAKHLVSGGAFKLLHIWDLEKATVISDFGRQTADEVKLALSPKEDKIYATYGWNSPIEAFDFATGKTLWSTPMTSHVWDVALHPSGAMLATAGNDGTICIINTDSGAVMERRRLGPAKGNITQVDFSPDGQLLGATMSNGTLVILQSPP